MDIEEIRKQKQKLEREIANLLNQFEQYSGTRVSMIGFTRTVPEIGYMTGRGVQSVDVEVTL